MTHLAYLDLITTKSSISTRILSYLLSLWMFIIVLYLGDKFSQRTNEYESHLTHTNLTQNRLIYYGFGLICIRFIPFNWAFFPIYLSSMLRNANRPDKETKDLCHMNDQQERVYYGIIRRNFNTQRNI